MDDFFAVAERDFIAGLRHAALRLGLAIILLALAFPLVLYLLGLARSAICACSL